MPGRGENSSHPALHVSQEEGAAESAQTHKKKKKDPLSHLVGDRDPYRLLELDELRWRASADEIRKAYRRLVLRYHPDKQAAAESMMRQKKAEEEAAKKAAEGGGDVEEGKEALNTELNKEEDAEDEMFKAITEAFELLSDVKKRRDFDSLDDFDDSIPTFKGGGSVDEFLATFASAFERNSRWSEVQPAPLLGGADASAEEVATFYNFWFDFKSWRDFADADEHEVSDANFREQKRWMERENEKLRVKRRREEKLRIERLVEGAYAHDPRVKAMQDRERAERARTKAERNARLDAARQAKVDAEAAELAAKAAAEAAAAEVAEAERKERKRLKEQQAKALRKQRQRLRAICADGKLCEDETCQELCASLPMDRLEELCAQLEHKLQLSPADASAAQATLRNEALALRKELAKQPAAAAEAAGGAAGGAAAPSNTKGPGRLKDDPVRPPWTDAELQLLVKAQNKIPGGVPVSYTHLTLPTICSV